MYEKSSTGIVPIFLAIISMFALPCLQWIFDAEETADVSYSTATCHVIKHLMNHSLYDLTAALESSPNISEAMTLLQNLELPREKRRECNKVFVACLQSWKGPDKTFVWMKRNIAHETCKTIFEDHQNSGTWREIQIDMVEDWLKESQQKFQNFSFKKSCSSCRPIQGCSCCKRYCGVCKERRVTCSLKCDTSGHNLFPGAYRFALILATYLDLTKDMILLVTILSVIQFSLFFEFGTFSSTIAWILVASIFPPLLLSAIETAAKRPTSILGFKAWRRLQESPASGCKMWFLRTIIVLFYPVIPAINICAREAAKEEKTKLLKQTEEEFHQHDGSVHTEALEKLAEVESYLLEARQGIMTFKMNELSLEVPLQLGLQLIMLLLSLSSSTTHSGLQALFQQEFQASI